VDANSTQKKPIFLQARQPSSTRLYKIDDVITLVITSYAKVNNLIAAL